MKILTSMSKIFAPNLKTAQLKQIDSIALVSNLLLYFIGAIVAVFTSYNSLYNLTMSNYFSLVFFFNFLYLIL